MLSEYRITLSYRHLLVLQTAVPLDNLVPGHNSTDYLLTLGQNFDHNVIYVYIQSVNQVLASVGGAGDFCACAKGNLPFRDQQRWVSVYS